MYLEDEACGRVPLFVHTHAITGQLALWDLLVMTIEIWLSYYLGTSSCWSPSYEWSSMSGCCTRAKLAAKKLLSLSLDGQWALGYKHPPQNWLGC